MLNYNKLIIARSVHVGYIHISGGRQVKVVKPESQLSCHQLRNIIRSLVKSGFVVLPGGIIIPTKKIFHPVKPSPASGIITPELEPSDHLYKLFGVSKDRTGKHKSGTRLGYHVRTSSLYDWVTQNK